MHLYMYMHMYMSICTKVVDKLKTVEFIFICHTQKSMECEGSLRKTHNAASVDAQAGSAPYALTYRAVRVFFTLYAPCTMVLYSEL